MACSVLAVRLFVYLIAFDSASISRVTLNRMYRRLFLFVPLTSQNALYDRFLDVDATTKNLLKYLGVY